MNYKSPKLTVDGVILKNEKILLIKRGNHPFKGKWALPGGFVEYGEKTEDAVIREVFEETGLKTIINQLVGVYSDPKRDPRGHTITIVYNLEIRGGKIESSGDACDIKFFNISKLPKLSFDHNSIIQDVLRRIS
jgi:8-oxo-dGTP diphosphatase